jgi:tripartite-type tricarboxylate transporter receptor subunit TctC
MRRAYEAFSVLFIALAMAVAPLAAVAQAAEFPSRPVKILVGASPGGTTDTMARAIATEMTTALGQPVIVENKPVPEAIWLRTPSRNPRPTDTRCW